MSAVARFDPGIELDPHLVFRFVHIHIERSLAGTDLSGCSIGEERKRRSQPPRAADSVNGSAIMSRGAVPGTLSGSMEQTGTSGASGFPVPEFSVSVCADPADENANSAINMKTTPDVTLIMNPPETLSPH